MKYFLSLLFTLSLTVFAYAQESFRSPLDIPLVLSANFGELRPNHFHSGIDLKTQAVVNKSVYSIEDGHVSRIGVSAGGYGLVLYIDHPSGQTSLYAHLNSFAPKIAEFVKEEQYKQEQYTVNITEIAPDRLPVRKGELIAKSGNTGSSGGPHVHFEIRDTKTEQAIDALPYFKDQIKDNVKPEIRGIAIYPIAGEGVVNNSAQVLRQSLTLRKDGSYPPLGKSVEAWGTIGIGVYAIDRMSNTHNIYGIKKVRLYCNEEKIFSSDINTIDFSTTRMINSFTDYNLWALHKVFYMKSFIEPGNKLDIYNDIVSNGYIDINEEKTYSLRYELEDLYANKTVYNFSIIGKQKDIPKPKPCTLVMQWDKYNRFISDSFSLIIPPNNLYKDINFSLTTHSNSTYYAKMYKVHDSYEPLNDYVNMYIQLEADTLSNKSQYGVVSIGTNGKKKWIGGEYDNGRLIAKIRDLGDTYSITADSVAPKIISISPENWTKNERIVVRLTDDLSGIKDFKGTINGEYALFEHDIKSPNYTYTFDPDRLAKGHEYTLIFTATDSAGNSSEEKYSFSY